MCIFLQLNLPRRAYSDLKFLFNILNKIPKSFHFGSNSDLIFDFSFWVPTFWTLVPNWKPLILMHPYCLKFLELFEFSSEMLNFGYKTYNLLSKSLCFFLNSFIFESSAEIFFKYIISKIFMLYLGEFFKPYHIVIFTNKILIMIIKI